ncbi:MAG TPA: phosphatase PAP2 family protein [Chitinophagaceae bacterium]|nr:phosphatase PAP2 family protein [Chitinophagaceae bacterium]
MSTMFFFRYGRSWSLIALLCSIFIHASSQSQTASTRLKTWVLTDAGQIKVPPPPIKEQTQKEIAEVKEKIAKRNEKILYEIQYWDAGSPAYRWNEIAWKMTTFENFGTFLRAPMAWMNMAISDATAAAWKAKYTYQRKRPFQIDPSVKPVITSPTTPSYPCEHSVTASAAANVLAYFFPEVADSILRLGKEAAESRIYAGVQFPSDVKDGWKLGEQVAALIIAQAKKDGSDIQWKGTMRNDPKIWRGEYPVGITAAGLKPIVLKSGDQFRPPPPPDFSNDMKALKSFKRNSMSDHLALYWRYLTGLDFWTELASKKMFELHLDKNAPLSAHIYTVLHVTIHDASIAIMDAKYAYWGIRPFQYDTTFTPLFETPPFPGYPSGHATASSAAATVLSYFFPADAEFFNSKAKECADSRFYAGIHFQTDNQVGLEMGHKLARYIIDNRAKNDYVVK